MNEVLEGLCRIRDAAILAIAHIDDEAAIARGIDSPEGIETRSGSTAQPPEPGHAVTRTEQTQTTPGEEG